MKRTEPQKLARGLKRVLLVVAVVMMALIVRRYDYGRVPDAIRDLGDEAPPGSSLILARVREASKLGVGTLVQVEFQGQLLLSKIAGVEGETIEMRPLESGFELRVGGRLMAALPRQGSIPTGPIPAGRFLLVDPDPAAGGADSRHVGLVTRDQIRRKILAVFKP